MGTRIYLIGCGSGEAAMLSGQARGVLESADLVIGAGRLLDSLGLCLQGRQERLYKTDEIAEKLRRFRTQEGSAGQDRTAAVLLSGDTGFFSGAIPLARVLDEEGIPFTILPGISSMAMLAAKLHTSYSDWNIVSLHGTVQTVDEIRSKVTEGIMTGRRTCYLTGGHVLPQTVLLTYVEAGLGNLQAAVGEALFTDSEKVTRGKASELAGEHFSGMAVLLMEASPAFPARAGGLPDALFTRGHVPMTKQYTRAAILAAMGAVDGSTIWDIGAGTGSVSVELALSCRKSRVFAIEKDPEGVRLICENREKFHCYNLFVCQGKAPRALEGLPKPDFVFIGGSSGNLKEIIDTVYAASPSARVTLTSVTIETAAQAADLFGRLGSHYEVVQISQARSEIIGHYHMMRAENPVIIVTAEGEGKAEVS